MPTVFSGRLDGSEAIRYFHVSLVTFYLRSARAHAISAAEIVDSEMRFKESLLAVIFATLCLEAFANEMGENVVPSAELDDFFRGKNLDRKAAKSMVLVKLLEVFRRKWEFDLLMVDGIYTDIEDLFSLRNQLVHYQIGKSAEKAYLEPLRKLSTEEEGQFMTVIDFLQKPVRVEPPLTARVDAKVASHSYNTALRVMRIWNEKAGAPPDALSAHVELAST